MKKLTVVLLMILIIAVTTIVNADTDTFELNLEVANKSIKAGDTIKVDVVLDNISVTSGEKGIAAVQGKLIYDTNVFEVKGTISGTNWEVSNENGSFVANTKDAKVVTTKVTVCTFELKAKEDAAAGNTNFKLEKVQGSAAGSTVTGTASNTITVNIEKISNSNSATNAQEQPSTSTSENKTTQKTNASTATSKSTNNIPKTGKESVILILLTGSIIILSVAYMKYKKYKNC